MSKPRVAVGSLGGTITMTSDGATAVTPTLLAADLVAAVPALADAAALQTQTLAVLPGASLSHADVLGALAWARGAVDDGAEGVVLVQGTDTLEETAYLLDLFWDRPQALVVTGAMRSPQQAGSDGPANLLAAVLTAAQRDSDGLGVLVVLNDEVHAAVRVAKGHSMAVDAFHSPVFGPLGRLVESRVVYGNRPNRQPHLPMSVTTAAEPRVALLTTHLGDRGELLQLVLDAGYDGVVLAGLGVGHVSATVAELVGKAAEHVPVVLGSRVGAGPTATRTYGFAGSESDLIARGAVPAGWLTPVKARLLLWSLLRLGCSPSRVGAEFADRGGRPSGPEDR